jgi:anoctamin-7
MSIWAVLFLELWKRKSERMAQNWYGNGVEQQDLEDNEFKTDEGIGQPNNSNYSRQVKIPRPVRIVLSTGIICTMSIVAIIAFLSVVIYEQVVENLIHQHVVVLGFITPSMFAEFTGGMVEFFFILILARLYKYLALIITKWEKHRTQAEFEDELAFKLFIFQFINHNVAMFYVAFIRGKFVGRPGNYGRFFFGMRNDTCSEAGCQFDILVQLFCIAVGRNVADQIKELAVPKIKNYFRKKKLHLDTLGNSRIEQDFKLPENVGLLDEYMQLMLQFGFVTLFVSSFPLLPLIALFFNLIETRLDAQKFVCETRRPTATREKDIGIWYSLLSVLGKIAVITNSFLIAFSSDFIERAYYYWTKDSIKEDYTLWTLSLSPNDYKGEPCYYNRFTDTSFTQLDMLALKLAFVLVFNGFVFGIRRFVKFSGNRGKE